MSRLITICSWVMVICLTGIYGCASQGVGPTATGQLSSTTSKKTLTPGETRDLTEAQALSEKAQELMKAGEFEDALNLAMKALDIRVQALGPEHPAVADTLIIYANIQMAWAESSQAQTVFTGARWGRGYSHPLGPYKRALKIREKALGPGHPETAASLADLAKLYRSMGSYAQALPLAQRALRIREQALGADHPQTADSLGILAMIYAQTGAPEQALPLAQRALKIKEQALGPDHPQTADSLSVLAMVYAQAGSYAHGLTLAQRTLKINEKAWGPESPQTADSLALLGLLSLTAKEFSQAEAFFKRAQNPLSKRGLVEVYLAQGRYEEAWKQLSATAPGDGTPPQAKARYYTQSGRALQGLGRRPEAAAAFSEAIQIIEELRARTPGERTSFFEAEIISPYFRAYGGMVAVLGEMAQKGEAFPSDLQKYGPDPGAAALFFAEAVKARALLEAMAAGTGRNLGEQLPADLAAKEQRLREAQMDLEARRDQDFSGFAFIPGEAMRRPVRTLGGFQQKMDALQGKQQELVAELRRRAPRYAALFYPQPYKGKELPLKSGEVLLEYVLGEKEGWVFRVEPGGKTQVFRLLSGQAELQKKLAGMLAPFRQSALRREDLKGFSVSGAVSLYQELLAPVLAGVAPGTRLIIVPDGVLGAFPFEALVVQSGQDWGNSVLVGDRFAVTYAQSASILALNRNLSISQASQPVFALGDCIYEKDSPRYLAYKAGQGKPGLLAYAGSEKALTMAATVKEWGQLYFPPLPETRKTVENLAALFGVAPQAPQVLLDVLATETQLRKAPLEKYRYFFFGTHGFLADKMSGVQEPVLVLTQVENTPPDDGFLTFSEVMNFKLDADVVTLAACMTGVGRDRKSVV